MHKHLKTYIITLFVLVAGVVSAGLISRITTFTDGTVLFASDLNGEFNQLVNLVNGNLDNDNISASAAISPSKITAAIAGDGLSRNGSTGELAVNTDDATLEVSSDAVRIKEITGLSVLGRSVASTGVVAAITGTDGQALRVSGTSLGFGTIATAGIADAAVTQAKRAALGQQVSSSSGSFSTSASTFTDVTNLSVTLTTTGRPVFVTAYSVDTAGGASAGVIKCNTSLNNPVSCFAAITVDGSVASSNNFNLNTDGNGAGMTLSYPCSAISYFDLPSAGSHTYKMQVKGTSTSVTVINCKLVGYEL